MRNSPPVPPAGTNDGGSNDQEMAEGENNNTGERGEKGKGSEENGGEENKGPPNGREGNSMNGGTGGLTADDFNILLSLRLERPPDDSPTKVISEFFQTLQKAEPKAHIPPQMKYTEEAEILSQPGEVPDRRRLRFYFTETSQS